MNYTFAFFGSDEFSIIVLEELIQVGYTPSLCITQPDKPKGRKLVLTPTPIKEFCLAHSIPCITPEKLIVEEIKRLKGSVTMIVIAHRLSTLENCDKIIVLENGTIKDIGESTIIINKYK
jgi:methionyl-tRNA formyltransferase